ncbi:MAG: hypothetical protein ACI89J_004231 [Hyphomicrobiaceae bacterium]|jgi:hypothetical protein
MPVTASTPRKKKSPPKASAREAAIRARSSVKSRVSQRSKTANASAMGRGRVGKKSMSIYMHPLAKDLMKQIAKDQKTTIQDLGIEALNLLFRKYNHKPIA